MANHYGPVLTLVLLTYLSKCQCQVVQTGLGEIRGVRSDDGFDMYLGVPYALVDEDNLFGAPIPHPGYTSPILAYSDGTSCPQTSRGNFVGTLQCLVLNVYVPENTGENLLPVLVYTHGGGWFSGSSNRGIVAPKFLFKHGIIFVSLNYRVGIHGFLCTDSPRAPGNAGLKDQLVALRWVKEHIASFGGDPDKVTIHGHSAGSMSTHLHLLSHHERLYERVIIQSGPANSPFSFVEQQNQGAFDIANALGLSTNNLDEAVDFIAKAPTEDLVMTAFNLNLTAGVTYLQAKTKACVEKQFEGIEAIVKTHPNIARTTKAKDVDILIGHASEEMIYQYANRDDEFYNTFSFYELLEHAFTVKDDNMEDLVAILQRFYLRDQETNPDLELEINQYGSDLIWNHPTERSVDNLLEDEARVIYKYMFSYIGNRNFIRSNNTAIPGAAHVDDMGYLFDVSMFRNQDITEDDQRIIDQMTTMWTNFVKYGNPTPEPTDLVPLVWEPVTNNSRPYLNIDQELTIKYSTYHDRMSFWDLFYYTTQDRAKGFETLN